MLATCSGANAGASSITTRPPGSVMYRVSAGSSVRQSEGCDAARSSAGDFGAGVPSAAADAVLVASAKARATGRTRAGDIGRAPGTGPAHDAASAHFFLPPPSCLLKVAQAIQSGSAHV